MKNLHEVKQSFHIHQKIIVNEVMKNKLKPGEYTDQRGKSALKLGEQRWFVFIDDKFTEMTGKNALLVEHEAIVHNWQFVDWSTTPSLPDPLQ